jgi:hypothetical protein
VLTSIRRRAAAEVGRHASLSSHALSFTRRVLVWIAWPLVLAPCAAIEAADQPKEICPGAICIVLATPDAINDSGNSQAGIPAGRHGTVLVSDCRSNCSYEVDTITATITTPIRGSLEIGRSVRAMVLGGSVKIDQKPESYLLILWQANLEFADYYAIEAYPLTGGKVCTFRSLKDYASGGASLERVLHPLSERKNCYSVDDLRHQAW